MAEPLYIFNTPADLKRLSEMVFVEGGTFRMGSTDDDKEAFDDEKPAHDVQLTSFYIGKYLVTQSLWKAVMNGENPSDVKGDERPVENVSWEDIVQEFLPKLNKLSEGSRPDGMEYRLSTEAQWEYAAKGGKFGEHFPFKYSGSDKLNEVGWYDDNSHRETKPVGLKTPNLLGLYDMSGNVYEWCEDHWHSNYKSAPNDGSAWADREAGTLRVVRSGYWDGSAQFCRTTYRFINTPTYRLNFFGFRLALFSLSV